MQPIASYFSPQLDFPRLQQDLAKADELTLMAVIRQMTQGRQKVLFDAAKGVGRLTLDLVVPIDGRTILLGRNAVPIPPFWKFEKRVFRTTKQPDVIYGYNEYFWRDVLGPGYFTAEQRDGELYFDYDLRPPATLDGWASLGHNDKGLARLPFYHLQDTVRWVTDTFYVGRVQRNHQPTNQWFAMANVGKASWWPHIPL